MLIRDGCDGGAAGVSLFIIVHARLRSTIIRLYHIDITGMREQNKQHNNWHARVRSMRPPQSTVQIPTPNAPAMPTIRSEVALLQLCVSREAIHGGNGGSRRALT